MFGVISDLTSLLTLWLFIIQHVENETPPGHLQRLGAHQEPKGITMVGKFSRPKVFFGHFVEPGLPLLMRGALYSVNHPGLTNWTDDYLREHYGSEHVKVENSRKENRQGRPTSLTIEQFLRLYQTENIYLVHSLNGNMKDLVLLPESLQCGGFQKVLQEAVLWMGSGDTASVLHYDSLDNLLCLLDGHKDVVLIDKDYKTQVESVGFNREGGYLEMDVDRVDLKTFSHFQNISWRTAPLRKGDCLFIPKGWYHQVRSSSPRHLAVNLWLSHLMWYNTSDCQDDSTFKPLKSIQEYGFASPNEVSRFELLDVLHDKGLLVKDALIVALSNMKKERVEQFFRAVDKNADSVLSWTELYEFDIDYALLSFPDIFGLPHKSVKGEENENIILYKVNSIEKDDKSLTEGDDNFIKDILTGSEIKEKRQSEAGVKSAETVENSDTDDLLGANASDSPFDVLDNSDSSSDNDFDSNVSPSEEKTSRGDNTNSDILDPDGLIEDHTAEAIYLVPDDPMLKAEDTRDDRIDEGNKQENYESQKKPTKVQEEL